MSCLEANAPVTVRAVCGKDYSNGGRRSTIDGVVMSQTSSRGETLSGAGLLAGTDAPVSRAGRLASRFSEVVLGFRDLPKEKACDWIAGYLPAFIHDLQLDLTKPSRNSHRKILDYGCGKGAVASYLVQFAGVKYVLGCDIDERCLQEARQRTTLLQKSLAFELLSREGECNLPSSTFDGAMCNFLISVLCNKAQQLRILHRIKAALTPGAPFVMLVNNPASVGTKFASIQVGEQGATYEPGELVHVQMFDMDTREKYFESRDRWWPVEHYVELFVEAGFVEVRAETRTVSLQQHSDLMCSIDLDPTRFQVESSVAPVLAVRGINPK